MEQFTPFDRLFQSCGRIWHIRRADMDKLWADMDQKKGGEDRLPYWNEIWPSSLALAGWLAEMQDDIKGKPCLDMGCGLGFTALLSLDLITAGGCAKASNLASCAASAVVWILHGQVLWALAIPALACSIAGNYLGALYAIRGGSKKIRSVMFLVLGLLFVKMLYELLF